ncbi:MAG: hypothetical protein M3Z06_14570, partial [Actinomycetota bacterium]|nr:hypothetical protein [Actinomycetota bacterium]
AGLMGFSAGESVGSIHASLELDRDAFIRSLDAARESVKRFEGERHRVEITATVSGIQRAKEDLRAIHNRDVKVKVDVQRGPIERLVLKLRELHDKHVEIKVDTDRSGLDRVQGDLQKVAGQLDQIKFHAVGLRPALAAMSPALLPLVASLGQGVVGAGALGVAATGAGLSFGVLGLAVKSAITSQGNYYKNLQAVVTAQHHLTAAQKTGNTQLIQAAQQQLRVVQQNAQQQNQLAQHVRNAWARVQDSFRQAMGPAVQQVLQGMSSALHTLGSSIGLLTPGMTTLGKAVHAALSSPAVQSGIRSLIAGFGKLAGAAGPLVGPIMRGVINLGKVFENIARAAMPSLVREVTKVASWLGKVAAHTSDTAKLRGEIERMVKQFDGWVKAAMNLGKALLPLFKSAAGFQPLLNAVISLVGWFVQLLTKLGPIGKLLAGGLGLVLVSSHFRALNPLLGVAAKGLGLIGKAMFALATGGIAGLITKFPALATGFWALDGAIGGMGAAIGGAVLAAAPFIIAIAAIGGAVLLVIHFHKQLWAAIKWTWNAIKDVVKAVVGAVVDAVKWAWNAVKNVVTTVGHAIGAAVSAAWNEIKKVVSTVVKAVVGVVVSAWNKLGEITRAAWKAITGALKAAWDAIKTAVHAGIDAVVNVVKSLPGRVLSGLGNIASFLFNAGKDLIMGLINGILSMGGAVIDAAKSIVSSVGDFITSGFGIFSPSTVAHGWGHNIGLGMANGITASVPHVLAAAGKLAAASQVNAAHSAQRQNFAGGGWGRPRPTLGSSPAATSGSSPAATSGSSPHVTIISQSLVPGSAQELQRIAGTVTGALRRTGRPGPPLRVAHGR